MNNSLSNVFKILLLLELGVVDREWALRMHHHISLPPSYECTPDWLPADLDRGSEKR